MSMPQESPIEILTVGHTDAAFQSRTLRELVRHPEPTPPANSLTHKAVNAEGKRTGCLAQLLHDCMLVKRSGEYAVALRK